MANCLAVASPSHLINEGRALSSKFCREVMSMVESVRRRTRQGQSAAEELAQGRTQGGELRESSQWASSLQAGSRRARGKLEVSSPYSSSLSSSLLRQACGASSPGRPPNVVLVCSLNVSSLNSCGWGKTHGQWDPRSDVASELAPCQILGITP